MIPSATEHLRSRHGRGRLRDNHDIQVISPCSLYSLYVHSIIQKQPQNLVPILRLRLLGTLLILLLLFPLSDGLLLPHGMVATLLGQQLGVRATFDNLAFVKNHDLV